MKKYKLIALAAAFSLALTATSIIVSGDEAGYDSSNDPLISLSYIEKVLTPKYEEKIEELTKKYENATEIITMLQSTLTKAEGKISELENKLTDGGTSGETAVSSGYEVVYMKKGAKLLAKTPCEIILRTGSAIIVSITSNGLNDITNGDELLNAVSVPLYHCLLVPRGNDGRGIQITSNDAYVMVRGEYEIVE